MKDYLEKRREELKKRDGGFTLMEMLIVVAIIAVLIAIAIPVFTTQLENSREATDKSNLRAAYSEQMAALISWDGDTEIEDVVVHAEQVQDGWQSENGVDEIEIAGGIEGSGIMVPSQIAPDGEWTVSADTENMVVTIEGA